MKFARRWRIAVQKHFLQPQCTERFRDRIEQTAVFARNNFSAAAADVHQQYALAGMRPLAHHTVMDQAGFFASVDDFDGGAESGRGSRQEFALVRSVAHGTGRDRADSRDVELAVGIGHARENARGVVNRLVAETAITKYARAEAGDFAVGGKFYGGAAGDHFGGEHSGGVASDVHGGVSHS